MTASRLSWLPFVLALACSHPDASRTDAVPTSSQGATKGNAAAPGPAQKDIVRALFANHDVPLSVHPSCAGVGTDPGDKTIGDYLSGFLAEHSARTGSNWLEIEAAPAAPGVNAEPQWTCRFVIRRNDGEERWGWGVTFVVSGRPYKVDRSSFRCTGAG